MSSLLLLKIAYEFVALIIGGAIYGNDPRLDELRHALIDRTENVDAFDIDRLEVVDKAASPLHGIWFEGAKPHAIIQIRLFGKRRTVCISNGSQSNIRRCATRISYSIAKMCFIDLMRKRRHRLACLGPRRWNRRKVIA